MSRWSYARPFLGIVFLLLSVSVITTPSFIVAYPPPSVIRGVNLGGWLVLEPWITPSLFDPYMNATNPPLDEYTLTQMLGPFARGVMEHHWDTWLQRRDLEELAAAGITNVRIPVGYWMVDVRKDEPFVEGGWKYLERALEWCQKIGLKVLIDLHGAPGSQNGFDNSGRRGPIHWADLPPVNYYRSLSAIANLTSMLKGWSLDEGGPVHAIQLVNEPFSTIPLQFVQKFYIDGYDVVRGTFGGNGGDGGGGVDDVNEGFDLFIHDSFRLGTWNDFMLPPDYEAVYLDTHQYHVFDIGQLKLDEQGHIRMVCEGVAKIEAAAAQSHWLVTGEWSLATTDCARWLNGFLTGSRWEGTLNPGQPALGNCTGNAGNIAREFTPEYRSFLRQFAEIQMDVYENPIAAASSSSARKRDRESNDGYTGGWYFWNFKTEMSPQWDFLQGLREGWIPNPVSNRTHSCHAWREERRRQRAQHEEIVDIGAAHRPVDADGIKAERGGERMELEQIHEANQLRR